MIEFNPIAHTLTTETLARIVAELAGEDRFTTTIDESIVVRDATFIGRARVGNEFDKLIYAHCNRLRQDSTS